MAPIRCDHITINEGQRVIYTKTKDCGIPSCPTSDSRK